MNERNKLVAEFLEILGRHADRKAKMYDGVNKVLEPDVVLRYLIEEAGEVATAITRERYRSARDECVDVAHVAMLMYIALSEGNWPDA